MNDSTRPEDMAMVGTVVAPVSEYIDGHFDHLAGISHVSGNR
jgi:hypothetical protein